MGVVGVVVGVEAVMREAGCRQIGRLGYQLDLSIWWHPQQKVELLLVELGHQMLLKGSKTYYLRSISEAGETWARDIGPLHDYLEAHFRELRLSFSYFRDVPDGLARRRAEQTRRQVGSGASAVVTAQDLARLQKERARAQQQEQSVRRLQGLSSDDGLLGAHLQRQINTARQARERLDSDVQAAAAELSLLKNLQDEYRRRGSAAALTFSISSNLQLASTAHEASDPVGVGGLVGLVGVVLRELADADRYEVRQRLCGGRLRLQVAEAEEPELVWIEQWLGGALNPNQQERLRPNAPADFSRHLEVTPNEDIQIDASVMEHRKLVAPRAAAALLSRLDRTEQLGRAEPISEEALPLHLGLLMTGEKLTDAQAVLPLQQFRNGYVSGATGSGKTYLMRVIAEEACGHDDVSVLVIDPRNQAVGLIVPEDRREILERYELHDTGKPRGFSFEYCAPGMNLRMPDPLKTLGFGHHILSLKGLDDEARCNQLADVLEAVFAARSAEEAENVRLLILIEEAQLFTKRQAAPGAKKAAERAEVALERCFREGRKYGLCTIVSSQSIKDFAYGSAAVRQNANARFFLQNADRELEYARDHLDDPRQLVSLKPGEVIACNPAWGSVKIAVRRPRSKVWEFSDSDTRRLVSAEMRRENALSADARGLLKAITDHEQTTGAQADAQGQLNVGRLATLSGITSKRRLLALLEELEHAGLVRSRRLPERGSPRVIELVEDSARTQGGQNADRAGQGES